MRRTLNLGAGMRSARGITLATCGGNVNLGHRRSELLKAMLLNGRVQVDGADSAILCWLVAQGLCRIETEEGASRGVQTPQRVCRLTANGQMMASSVAFHP